MSSKKRPRDSSGVAVEKSVENNRSSGKQSSNAATTTQPVLGTPSHTLSHILSRGWALKKCVCATCKCKGFEAGKSALICRCAHRAAAHSLHSTGGGGLAQLFADIRNARVAGNNGLDEEWGQGWKSDGVRYLITSALNRAEQLGGVLHDVDTVVQHLQKAVTLLKIFASQGLAQEQHGERCIRIAAALDIAYWHVHYSALTAVPEEGSRIGAVESIVPSPEIYFTALAGHMPTASQTVQVLTGSLSPSQGALLLSHLSSEFDLDILHQKDSSSDEIVFSIDSNPLLATLQASWLELEVCAKFGQWSQGFALEPSPYEGTMRGSDPLLPAPLRVRCDSIRDWAARIFSFAVPNNAAKQLIIDACSSASSNGTAKDMTNVDILEIGAGTSYWKWWLQRLCSEVSYTALDKDPPPAVRGALSMTATTVASNGKQGKKRKLSNPESNEYHGRAPGWSAVQVGGPSSIPALFQGVNKKDAVLLLCYPPPSGTVGLDCVRQFSGDTIIYIGEIKGDTGTPDFEIELCKNFDLYGSAHLPCFANTASLLMVFKRRKNKGAKTPLLLNEPSTLSLLKCNKCGSSANLRRCRVTRAVCYCSRQCYADDVHIHQIRMMLRHVSVTNRALSSGSSNSLFDSKSAFKILAKEKKKGGKGPQVNSSKHGR